MIDKHSRAKKHYRIQGENSNSLYQQIARKQTPLESEVETQIRYTSKSLESRNTLKNLQWKCNLSKIDAHSKSKNAIEPYVETIFSVPAIRSKAKNIIESQVEAQIPCTSKSLESKNHYRIHSGNANWARSMSIRKPKTL